MHEQLALVARNIYTLRGVEGAPDTALVEGIFVTHEIEYTASGDRHTVAHTHRIVSSPKAWRKVAEDIVAWADEAEGVKPHAP